MGGQCVLWVGMPSQNSIGTTNGAGSIEVENGFRRPHPSNRERGSPAHAGGRERGRFLPTNELLESKVPLVLGIPVLYRLFDPTGGKVKLFHSAPLFF